METHRLIPHSTSSPVAVESISAKLVSFADGWLQLRWRIEGSGKIIVPHFAGKSRADALWRTTCFEMFIRAGDGESYCEFNLSPCEQWAAYDFATYRKGMAERAMPREPVCSFRSGSSFAIFDAAVPMSGLSDLPWHYGLGVVIEEEG
ncbi:MAG: hypothetical protein P8J20_11930, partial [Novosphingobium sp.]|nr:hypothetical protein [Novosphingobium sp.]